MMTEAEALLYFTLQITTAARHVGVEPPRVVTISPGEQHPGATMLTQAYVVPCAPQFECDATIHIFRHALQSRTKKELRCIARHEVSHLFLGHRNGARDHHELQLLETQVKYYQLATWDEDSACGLK